VGAGVSRSGFALSLVLFLTVTDLDLSKILGGQIKILGERW